MTTRMLDLFIRNWRRGAPGLRRARALRCRHSRQEQLLTWARPRAATDPLRITMARRASVVMLRAAARSARATACSLISAAVAGSNAITGGPAGAETSLGREFSPLPSSPVASDSGSGVPVAVLAPLGAGLASLSAAPAGSIPGACKRPPRGCAQRNEIKISVERLGRRGGRRRAQGALPGPWRVGRAVRSPLPSSTNDQAGLHRETGSTERTHALRYAEPPGGACRAKKCGISPPRTLRSAADLSECPRSRDGRGQEERGRPVRPGRDGPEPGAQHRVQGLPYLGPQPDGVAGACGGGCAGRPTLWHGPAPHTGSVPAGGRVRAPRRG